MKQKQQKELALELKCFHGDGCTYSFHTNDLCKVLSSALIQKYEEMQFQLSIKKAGLFTSLRSCPKCGYQCDVPSTQNVFTCPVDICRYVSCVLCNGPSHLPLRCSEVIKDKVETENRLTIEEAITAAKIRKCPKCYKPFIKSDGCNKITCSCGVYLCYECCKVIKDYSHFCQIPHCDHKTKSCKNKCRLHTNDKEDDIKAMREAGFKAQAAAAADNNNKTNIQSQQIDIEKYIS